jgi:hypothetical protein
MKFLILLINIFFLNIAVAGLFGEKSAKVKGPLNENEGLVVVQFVNNSRVQGGLSNWDEVVLENMNSKKTFKLLPILNNGLLSSIVFAGVLQEGKYRLIEIKEISEYANAGVYTRVNAIPITSNLGEFTVTNKSITNLGTVILYPIYVKLENGDLQRNLVSIKTKENNHLVSILKELKKQAYQSTSENTVTGWDEDSSGENELFLQKVYLHGVPFKYKHIENSNSIIIFHKLGGVTFIEEGKEPVEVHTGYYSNFMSYLKTDNGHLLGGENGLILFSTSLKGTWQKIDIFDSIHNIVDLYYENKNLIAISSFYKHPCPENLSCEGTNKFSINLDNNSYALISTKAKDFNYPNVIDSYFLVPEEKFVFGQRLEYKLINDILISHKPGMLSSFTDTKHKISFNNGKSWKKIKTYLNKKFLINGYNSDRPIYVNTDKMVYVVATTPSKGSKRRKSISSHNKKKKDKNKNTTIQQNNRPEKNQVYLYKMPIDDIDTHSSKYIVSKIDPYCSRLIPDISTDDTLYISCINGNVINTIDDGKTWHVVYENK